MVFWGLNFQALKKTEVTKDNTSLHASLQKQMLARNILCFLILKLNVMDVKLYDLPLPMIRPFQDTDSLELEEAERGCRRCYP